MKDYSKYLISVIENNIGNFKGTQKLYRFENNYGASVIKTYGSYGHEKNLWELAVILFTNDKSYILCYETDITNDVIGYLNEDEVNKYLGMIKKLK